jgi:hypothetical protein
MFLAAHPTLLAQVGTDGSVLGVVKDATEAVVPGAEVMVVNLETGLKKTVITDQEGYFEVLALPRGFYSVAASLTGFKTWQLERTELRAGEHKRVSPILDVGQGTEHVNVEAGVELVQTEKGSIETGIEQKQIRDLPVNGRNPINLVNLAPGMRFTNLGGRAREHTVQGVGQRDDQTQFSVDGLDANDPSNEKGIAFPNLDTVAEFNVQTSNFSAENGRNPLQIILVTKSGTNEWHGTLWEFHRNQAFDARNAFVQNKPKLIRNQFGFTLGGPILRDKTHFFGSYEGTITRREQVYNSLTIAPAMLRGDFSGLPTIYDPLTRRPDPNRPGQFIADGFENNIIPENRISPASRFFFPFLLLPNAPGNRFRGKVARPTDTANALLRIDHQITNRQRLYGRWIIINDDDRIPGYRPGVYEHERVRQHNTGLNYNWSISPTTLLTVAAGYLYSDTPTSSPVVGNNNLTQQAGIRGFPTEGRAGSVGYPDVTITGYTGFSAPGLVPGRFGRASIDLKAGLHQVRGKHSIDFGYQWLDHRTLARHASMYSRGGFTFNGQYTRQEPNTGDAFADYLLGLAFFAGRNFPLQTFGMAHAPYSALYLQDFWRVHPNVTLGLGVRLDYWHERAFVRGTGSTFDPARGKAVAGENDRHQVDLSAQPTAPFLARATEGLWISASEAGLPPGLLKARGYLSPRLSMAWRPIGKNNLVVRGGYGIYTSTFNGNITGSQVIGPPYWTLEQQTFSVASLQRWETAFPEDPRAFTVPSVAAARADAKPMKSHQWNISIQTSLPILESALTISYVGNRNLDLVTRNSYNDPPPGEYRNLQAARPRPQFGPIRLYENIGRSWYNALQVRWERRFRTPLGYTLSYAFARNINESGASTLDDPTPYAPPGYNRGRSGLERRHILNVNAIYELPLGHSRKFGNSLPSLANAVLGGWQIASIYNFTSGAPLTFTVPGATLGNGWGTRANVVGEVKVPNPSADRWFNRNALVAPPRLAFGTSGIGLIDGPAGHLLHLALMKNFYLNDRNEKYLQFRWEMFNAPNHVNLGSPLTTINLPDTGKINSAGAAREMQFGLKFVF